MYASLLLGCGGPVDGPLIQPRWFPHQGPLESRCRPEMEPCVDLATVPVSWRAEGTWEVYNVVDLGDVTGDGVGDVSVTLFDPWDDRVHGSIVFGPIDRTLQLPSGEDLGFDEVPRALDVTGDGMTDLIVEGSTILAAPVSGATRPEDALGTYNASRGGYPLDLEGDLDLDYVVLQNQRIDVWRGEWFEWENEPPDLTLLLPCPHDGDPTDALLVVAPDLDLDGVAELWVAGSWPDSSYNDCTFYRIPANAIGELDVHATYPPAPLLPPRFHGDQDGDGVAEVGWKDRLLSLPVVAAGGRWRGEIVGQIAEVYDGLPGPLGVDVVGDRYPDLIQGFVFEDSNAVAYVAGGPDGGLFTGEVALHVLAVPGGSAEVFDGYALSVESSFVRIHPLD